MPVSAQTSHTDPGLHNTPELAKEQQAPRAAAADVLVGVNAVPVPHVQLPAAAATTHKQGRCSGHQWGVQAGVGGQWEWSIYQGLCSSHLASVSVLAPMLCLK
jgi:hypothetical protein